MTKLSNPGSLSDLPEPPGLATIPQQPSPGSFASLCVGTAIYLIVMLALVQHVRAGWDMPGRAALFAIGILGVWRLSWFLVNVTRAAWYGSIRFPTLRQAAAAAGPDARASEVYVLITSYRMRADVTDAVFRNLFAEAARYGVPTTVMASMASLSEQAHVQRIFGVRSSATGAPRGIPAERHGEARCNGRGSHGHPRTQPGCRRGRSLSRR